MIWNRDVLFIHVPKTGGMSISKRLLYALPRPVYYTNGDDEPAPGDPEGATHVGGLRHENLEQAREALRSRGVSLSRFRAILAVVRNPYQMEVSRYHYLRLDNPWDKGPAQKLALEGDFERFAIESPYLFSSTPHIERFFTVDGLVPPNLRLLRFETLQEDFDRAVDELRLPSLAGPLPRLNRTRHDHHRSYLTRGAEQAIYHRFRWLFDTGHYARARL